MTGILMEKREDVIGGGRVVMEVLVDCGFNTEMQVATGMIWRLVDENAVWKIVQHHYDIFSGFLLDGRVVYFYKGVEVSTEI